MTDEVRLPRKLSEEADAPKPVRPSHQKVIEDVERWVNSLACNHRGRTHAKTL